MGSVATKKVFRWLWRYDDRLSLLRICVWEGYDNPFKLSFGLQKKFFNFYTEFSGFVLTVLGLRLHYRKNYYAGHTF